MKTQSAVPLAGLSIVLATLLQGCQGPFGMMMDALNDGLDALFGAKKTKQTTTAKCVGKEFSCIGPDKVYCQRQEKLCLGGKDEEKDETCHPLCHWHCQEESKCEKACAPKCNPPVCQTRCKGFNTQSCHMKCQKPNCAVICPKTQCHSDGCVKCSTQCTNPTCHMECGKDLQNCRNVCAEPLCTWECKNPQSCPKPKCEMRCQEPKNCLAGSVHRELPEMEKGETRVVNFEANMSKLLQIASTSHKVRVNVSTMKPDNTVETREVELPAENVNMASFDDSESSEQRWTSMSTTLPTGQVIDSSASCKKGHFSCHGESDWCAEQKSVVCKASPVFRTQRAHKQVHLHA